MKFWIRIILIGSLLLPPPAALASGLITIHSSPTNCGSVSYCDGLTCSGPDDVCRDLVYNNRTRVNSFALGISRAGSFFQPPGGTALVSAIDPAKYENLRFKYTRTNLEGRDRIEYETLSPTDVANNILRINFTKIEESLTPLVRGLLTEVAQLPGFNTKETAHCPIPIDDRQAELIRTQGACSIRLVEVVATEKVSNIAPKVQPAPTPPPTKETKTGGIEKILETAEEFKGKTPSYRCGKIAAHCTDAVAAIYDHAGYKIDYGKNIYSGTPSPGDYVVMHDPYADRLPGAIGHGVLFDHADANGTWWVWSYNNGEKLKLISYTRGGRYSYLSGPYRLNFYIHPIKK